MKLGILTGHKGYIDYIKACDYLNIEYEIVDILSDNWISNLKESAQHVDGFLAKPLCYFQEDKDIYDERIYAIEKYLKKPIYPNVDALYLYESKRKMASFLEFYDIPHVKTRIFLNKESATKYFESAQFPLVQKSNFGSGGNTVTYIKNKSQAKKLTKKAFGTARGGFCTGIMPHMEKFPIIPLWGISQKHYMIVQDYHQIKWEWRILKIGNTYQGHQKLLKNGKASGSGLVGWVAPPKHLLYMVKDICEKGNFDVMDVDIFETEDGQFLVNELQAIFGSYLPYQMKINNVPCRYVYSETDGFVFEKGEFNIFGSKLLFVEDFIDKLKSGYYER